MPRSQPGSAPAHAKARRPRSRVRVLVGWAIFLAAVLLVATATRAYAVQTFYVPTPSMTPTLVPGDRIIVNKLSGTIHRFDIIVFNNPPADVGGPPVLVKRVIGLPGETISSTGSTVLIDGKPLDESWLPKLMGICSEPSEHIKPVTIAPDHYFVMGDCRGDSGASRYWGTVPGGNVIGKVDMIVWRNGHPWLHWF